jgi:hypothetical protein
MVLLLRFVLPYFLPVICLGPRGLAFPIGCLPFRRGRIDPLAATRFKPSSHYPTFEADCGIRRRRERGCDFTKHLKGLCTTHIVVCETQARARSADTALPSGEFGL